MNASISYHFNPRTTISYNASAYIPSQEVKAKTLPLVNCYMFFALPAGLRLAEVADSQLETRLSEILQKLGLLFQSQDDYLDCYGDPNVIGESY